MTDRELMQMALDALEKLNKDGWILADFEDEVYASIEALRARLAQPEQLITPGGGLPNDHNGVTAAQPDQEPVAWRFYDGGMWCYVDHLTDLPQNKFEPLYTAPPKILCGCGDQIMANDGAECGNCVTARNAVKQEPICVAFIRTLVGIDKDGIETWKDEPIYATPIKREWQRLTTQEIADETDIATSSNKDIFDIRKAFWCGARWAEAKLKGKNA